VNDTTNVIASLLEFAGDLPDMYTPEISDNYKGQIVGAIHTAVELIRTHALPIGHPLAVE
jgi:hypothetical protein